MSERAPLPRAKKSLGQHFLIDDNICRRIVAALDTGPEDRVVEIGPGAGALTRFLVQGEFERLILIEKDEHLAELAASEWPRAEVRTGDALEVDWAALSHPRLKVVGNLPYNVASRILWEMVLNCQTFDRGVFMIQREVADRLAAPAGNKQYGALSVWVQSFARVKRLFTVGPHLFRPRPKVDSAVVLLTPVAERPAHPERLALLVRMAFQSRRKQLGNALKLVWSPAVDAWLARQGLDRTIRSEVLTCEQFRELAVIMGGEASKC